MTANKSKEKNERAVANIAYVQKGTGGQIRWRNREKGVTAVTFKEHVCYQCHRGDSRCVTRCHRCHPCAQ
jgi:hypothetical protein